MSGAVTVTMVQRHSCDRLRKLLPSSVLNEADQRGLVSLPAMVESLKVCRMDTQAAARHYEARLKTAMWLQRADGGGGGAGGGEPLVPAAGSGTARPSSPAATAGPFSSALADLARSRSASALRGSSPSPATPTAAGVAGTRLLLSSTMSVATNRAPPPGSPSAAADDDDQTGNEDLYAWSYDGQPARSTISTTSSSGARGSVRGSAVARRLPTASAPLGQQRVADQQPVAGFAGLATALPSTSQPLGTRHHEPLISSRRQNAAAGAEKAHERVRKEAERHMLAIRRRTASAPLAAPMVRPSVLDSAAILRRALDIAQESPAEMVEDEPEPELEPPPPAVLAAVSPMLEEEEEDMVALLANEEEMRPADELEDDQADSLQDLHIGSLLTEVDALRARLAVGGFGIRATHRAIVAPDETVIPLYL